MTPGLTIQYLGQEGFLFDDGGTRLVIDPYLSDSVDRLDGFPRGFWTRAYPPPLKPRDLTRVDLVLCSHDHLDHADPETLLGIAEASPDARFAGPRATVALMHSIGIDSARTSVLNAGECLICQRISIEPIAAAHEAYEVDADGYHRFLGFLLRWRGRTLYHAGDTVVTPELSQRLSRERIDIGFLPVNGADEARTKRGIVGNMDVEAAAGLAIAHRFGLFVPMHYDLYPNNGLSDDELREAWKHSPGADAIRLKSFRPGETLHFPAT